MYEGVGLGGKRKEKPRIGNSFAMPSFQNPTAGFAQSHSQPRANPGAGAQAHGQADNGPTNYDWVKSLLGDKYQPFSQQDAANMNIDPNFQERDRRASAAARRSGMDTYHRRIAEQGQQDAGPTKSFADYLRMAQEILGGMGGGPSQIPGVNYDPERNALRSNAATGDSAIASIYANLQQQFADAAPVIDKNYAEGGAAIDANTAQAAGNLQDSNTAINDETTRQLQALGIGDAAANTVPDRAADQSAAAAAIQQQGQIVGNQLDQNHTTAQNYNNENKATAGMEGDSKRAAVQAALIQALAGVDSRETDANAQIAQQNAAQQSAFSQNRQSSALSLAQQLMEGDPTGASALGAQQEFAAQQQQQQFENDLATATFNAKYGQQEPQQSPQKLLDIVSQLQQQAGWDNLDPKTYSTLLTAAAKAFQ